MNNNIDRLSEYFSSLKLLLIGEKDFHYANGGTGPYYIDLRKCCNNPDMFNLMLEGYGKYLNNNDDKNNLLIGVPTTGVIYATGLSLKYKTGLGIMEKSNPDGYHFYTYAMLRQYLDNCKTVINDKIENLQNSNNKNNNKNKKIFFLGLEDMGVMLSSALGLEYNCPSAILRRVKKGHGTSKMIEVNMDIITNEEEYFFYVLNDPYNPVLPETLSKTLNNLGFDHEILTFDKPEEISDDDINNEILKYNVNVIEDLWTTGQSSIDIYDNLKRLFGIKSEILVFLDREQGANRKLEYLGIKHNSVFKISEIVNQLHMKNIVTSNEFERINNYVKQFNQMSYMDKLLYYNVTSVCVGIDITPGKIPKNRENCNLPNFPYSNDTKGVEQYALDVLEEVSKTEVKFIKPNLGYYNSLSDPDLHQVLYKLLNKAKEKGMYIILDCKIGDIMRTQSQYAQKYKEFDSVTIHPYMGSDSIYPITDVQLGCYVLVFTSNPSRVDLETQPLLTNDILLEYEKLLLSFPPQKAIEMVLNSDKNTKVYNLMAQKVIDWQFSGSVGAVIGATKNSDGNLKEMKEIIEKIATELNYLPPILIPGVGAQGGSAKDVISTIIVTLKDIGWDENKIRQELSKVLINSSSGIDYAKDPYDAIQKLVKEIKDTINTFL